MYLLDTNTCIQYITGRSQSIADKFAEVGRQNISLCDVVKAELYYGVYKSSRRSSNLELYQTFFGDFVSLPFDGRAAETYGQIRVQLESLGTPIGPNDLLIAAVAISHNLILVTHNIREFSRVGRLRYED
ncbi:MAG: type II toxin-antitoxin system VapC family toxin [Myxacorys chilensis ATA2-1-KO14]|jgi:tRNA(fMet)-specific endonuclease VapC|nr:type II toxin-antitoxin system VapC family toxin [Myxacorys chilensis ATA2-1-KO14]